LESKERAVVFGFVRVRGLFINYDFTIDSSKHSKPTYL